MLAAAIETDMKETFGKVGEAIDDRLLSPGRRPAALGSEVFDLASEEMHRGARRLSRCGGVWMREVLGRHSARGQRSKPQGWAGWWP